MPRWIDTDDIGSYEDAVQAVLQGIGMRVDPRKVLWCNYPIFCHEHDELMEKVKKDTKKLEKEIDDGLPLNKLWYIGIPRFMLIRRGVAHLTCEIDLYYAAHDTVSDYPWCWYGKLIPKADKFDIPLCLINPLIDALSQGQMETNDAHIVERTPNYSIYDFMGREWKIPDAFLGFIWALKEKGKGFEGLLDPISCALMDKSTKELPSPEMPVPATGSYEEVVSALKNLGWNKEEAEKRAQYVLVTYPDISLEEKIKHALGD